MYEFQFARESGLFVFEFHGELKGAETDKALLEALTSLTGKERLDLRGVLIDWREVESADLHDTDGARMYHFHREVSSILGLSIDEALAFIRDVRLARLVDVDNPATETLLERLARTQPYADYDRSRVFEDIESAYRFLLLPL